MRVGVDATCWVNARGYGRHARALLGALVTLDAESEYTFFLDSAEAAASIPAAAQSVVVASSAPTAVAAAADGHRSIRDMWRMSRAMSSARLDVLLFPTIYSYVPVHGRARRVVMIHDVIAETFPDLTLPTKLGRFLWNTKVALGRRQADTLATVSDYSREALARRFALARERIHLVGEAADPMFRVLDSPTPTPRLLAAGVPVAGRTVVYVGGFGPHKNLVRLLHAFARLKSQPDLADVSLVLVGEHRKEVFHSEAVALEREIQRLGIGDSVVFTGYLPDEDLVVLLNRATVLALPSLMEGFGLPAVEAAACGCPVVATAASPLPGLLGEGGIYVDPTDAVGLQEALGRVLASEGLRCRMRAAGRAAASRLTWEAAARQMRAVLRAAVAA